MLQAPSSASSEWQTLIREIRADLGRKEPLVLGVRDDGTDMFLRFRAALTALRVRVHVQEAADGDVYDPAASLSSNIVDCRTNRVQDVTIPGTGVRYIYLIPIEIDGSGADIQYDGVNAEDFMSFVHWEV